MIRYKIIIYAVSALLVSSLLIQGNAFAHNFAPNESAQFLSLMRLLETKVNLVKQNLINNNSQVAQEHVKTAVEALTPSVLSEIMERNERVANDLKTSLKGLYELVLSNENKTVSSTELESKTEEIKAIIGETVSARIDPDQINNATVQALSFANLIDRILKSYGDAYDVGIDLTDMSQMKNIGMSMNMDMGNLDMTSGTNDTYSELVNVTGYQTAQALSKQAIEIFETEIESSAQGADRANITANLENSLIQLDNSIENKAFPMDVMMIVHTKIHPNILTIFNLPLVLSPS